MTHHEPDVHAIDKHEPKLTEFEMVHMAPIDAAHHEVPAITDGHSFNMHGGVARGHLGEWETTRGGHGGAESRHDTYQGDMKHFSAYEPVVEYKKHAVGEEDYSIGAYERMYAHHRPLHGDYQGEHHYANDGDFVVPESYYPEEGHSAYVGDQWDLYDSHNAHEQTYHHDYGHGVDHRTVDEQGGYGHDYGHAYGGEHYPYEGAHSHDMHPFQAYPEDEFHGDAYHYPHDYHYEHDQHFHDEPEHVLHHFGDHDRQTCWKRAYGRSAGTPVSVCAKNMDQSGALCYPKCDAGFEGHGPVCWQNCPEHFRDDGAFCYKPEAYGRGAGQANKCKDCEKWGGLFYPQCDKGFHSVGCCVCSPDCPQGMTDIGISCAKESYSRTAGTPLKCAEGLEQSGALCYPKCEHGSTGSGPVCWGHCPAGTKECGSLCLDKDQNCANFLAEDVKAAF